MRATARCLPDSAVVGSWNWELDPGPLTGNAGSVTDNYKAKFPPLSHHILIVHPNGLYIKKGEAGKKS